eukprot:CAMPEP_0206386660 /NCGR_PEP_ID=MMETSP0294-20121207/16086_1 /ASSEMBLY_ACC=CAM_ASM_000327 /TAXON_ID=39354 /ORGANISM="Heterosigma akashiwo, Strain CCMP2393" /LENGTH=40 /DNA_ID= /DNA_START= /DNA_END= /DNA_ORIENTATION=
MRIEQGSSNKIHPLAVADVRVPGGRGQQHVREPALHVALA